jgi:hypothetical protein
MLSAEQRREAADALATAERDRVPVPPLVERYADMDVVDSYEIQLLNIRRRIADGATVRTGDRIVTIEAMKMEHPVTAPHDGVVTLDVAAGEQVRRDQPLAHVVAHTSAGHGADELAEAAAAASTASSCGCLSTMASAYWATVRMVSSNDSPFWVLECDSLRITVWPPILFMAESNDVDVREEAS